MTVHPPQSRDSHTASLASRPVRQTSTRRNRDSGTAHLLDSKAESASIGNPYRRAYASGRDGRSVCTCGRSCREPRVGNYILDYLALLVSYALGKLWLYSFQTASCDLAESFVYFDADRLD